MLRLASMDNRNSWWYTLLFAFPGQQKYMNSRNKIEHSGKPSYLWIILKYCKMLCENKKSHCNKKTVIQVINEPIKESALLVLVVINEAKLVVKPKADGRHEMKTFKVTRMNSIITALHLTRANFSLFWKLFCRIPWYSKASDKSFSHYPHSHIGESWVWQVDYNLDRKLVGLPITKGVISSKVQLVASYS